MDILAEYRFTIILVFFIISLLATKMKPIVSVRMVPIMFTFPIVVLFALHENEQSGVVNFIFKKIFKISNICIFEKLLERSDILFFLIVNLSILYFLIFIVRLFVNWKSSKMCKTLRTILCAFSSIVVISLLLLFCYMPLSSWIAGIEHTNKSNSTNILSTDGGSKEMGSEGVFAILGAFIAAGAAMYGVRRTLKQVSTGNRQQWITQVRSESANLLAAVDKIKIYLLFNGEPLKERIEICHILVDSCTRLRMLINPKDILAPILIAQLDAITNTITTNKCAEWLYSENFNFDNNVAPSANIREIDLRRSFMPWVQILLKVEWERVKAILESRESLQENYYSEIIFREEWEIEDFKRFGVFFNDDFFKHLNDNKVDQNFADLSFHNLFPGFIFTNSMKMDIRDSLRKMAILKKRD